MLYGLQLTTSKINLILPEGYRGAAVRQQQHQNSFMVLPSGWVRDQPQGGSGSSNYSSDGLTQWKSRRPAAARRQQQTYLADV